MIGVFDSGYGGLTILRALADQLPQFSYIYFADNKNAPYGERSAEEITEFTKQGVEVLFNRGAQLVVLGCNTASAAALRNLQNDWLPKKYPERRILGIVVPTIEQITGADWRHESPITTPISPEVFTVGILATSATVASGAYPFEIHKRNRSINVVQQACPGLVELIEREAEEKVDVLLKKCIINLMKAAPDLRALLLGCTHYELIAPQITALLPPNVRLYHQPTIVAASLKAYLMKHGTLVAEQKEPTQQFFTTGEPAPASEAATRYFGKAVEFIAQ